MRFSVVLVLGAGLACAGCAQLDEPSEQDPIGTARAASVATPPPPPPWDAADAHQAVVTGERLGSATAAFWFVPPPPPPPPWDAAEDEATR